MEHRTTSSFDDATLLAYVEQTMTREHEAEFEAKAGSDARLLASLRQMRADRQALCALPEPQAPATLAADVLAQIERSMLLETDLVAPSINLRRYRATHWQRYAAAAGFVLLLTGGGFMLLNSLLFDSHDEHFAPEPVARGPAEPEFRPAGPESSADTRGEGEAAAEALAQSDAIASPAADPGAAAPGAFEALVTAMSERDESLVAASIDRDWPNDLDLFASISSADPEAAYEAIASRVRLAGADFIVNASINPAPPLTGPERSLPALAEIPGRADESIDAGEAPSPRPAAAPPAAPDDRIPIAEQSRYVARGFRFTILGTPSDILAALRDVSADRSLRISWSGSGAPRMLVDLAAPNLPHATRWDRVLLWWLDPAVRFDEARLAAARAFTEPVVRIPVRIVASDRR